MTCCLLLVSSPFRFHESNHYFSKKRHDGRWVKCGQPVPCSVAPFALRSLAVQSGRGETSKAIETERAGKRGRDGCMSFAGLQPVCVWETVTAATLQGTALQLGSKSRQKVETLGVRVQHLLQVRNGSF